MPYIKDQITRKILQIFADDIIIDIFKKKGITGNLNFMLFYMAKHYCNNYSDYQQFIGELEAAKLEIYRRLAAPYEDKKIKENGDVE